MKYFLEYQAGKKVLCSFLSQGQDAESFKADVQKKFPCCVQPMEDSKWSKTYFKTQAEHVTFI